VRPDFGTPTNVMDEKQAVGIAERLEEAHRDERPHRRLLSNVSSSAWGDDPSEHAMERTLWRPDLLGRT
jgi:hypothetical protein